MTATEKHIAELTESNKVLRASAKKYEAKADRLKERCDELLAERAALRAELEAANKRADASAKTAIEVLGATACERHQEEIRALPFVDFCEQEIKRGCIRCMSEQLDEARKEARKARAIALAIHEAADETYGPIPIELDDAIDELIELARQEREA